MKCSTFLLLKEVSCLFPGGFFVFCMFLFGRCKASPEGNAAPLNSLFCSAQYHHL